MPRFKQVQKVNTSLRLSTSGLASINFQWHLNASCNDPSRLLSGLLSSVCSCSRTDTALKCDPLWVSVGSACQPRRCSPRLGLGWMLWWNAITSQLSRTGPGPDGEAGKCLSLSRGEFWAARARLGAVCQTSRPPAGANFQSFLTFSRVEYLPVNFALRRWRGRWQPKPRPEPPLCRAEHKSWGHVKCKVLHSFQNYFSLGDFVTLQSWGGGMVPVFKHK